MKLSDFLSVDTLNLNWPGCECEYRFCHERKWRFDFAWPDRKVAVEIEGGLYKGGRHTSIIGFEGDCEKYNAAAMKGWMVLRYSTAMVKRGDIWIDLDNVFATTWGG